MVKLYWLSAIFWGGAALYYESPLGAGVAIGFHVISYQIHAVEVRLNKLLDHHRLTITEKDA